MPHRPMIPEPVLRLAEAVIFASTEPVTPRVLARVLPAGTDVPAVIEAVRARYAGRGVEVGDVAGGAQFRTALDLAPALRTVIEVPRRLTRVAMETLAIIAYHQPVTRPEIEHLRGASLSQQTMDALLEARLIAPAGRKEAPGRPTLWATTADFLSAFGLRSVKDLPRWEDLFVEPPRPSGQPAANDPGPSGSTGVSPRSSPPGQLAGSDVPHGSVTRGDPPRGVFGGGDPDDSAATSAVSPDPASC